jgi:hypothetical protein
VTVRLRPWRSARRSVLVALAILPCLASSAAPAGAQCVGDCSGDGTLAINELVTGVNIALGNSAVSACPSFDCQHTGMVPINCLIQGVNNALAGCPATPTVTVSSETATPSSETATPTVTPTATPTFTPGPIGQHVCTLVPGSNGSHLDLNVMGFTAPLFVPLNGSATIECGVADATGTASCRCALASIDPVTIVGVGKVCLAPSAAPCADGSIACAGGAPLGVSIAADGNVGACADNAACDTACTTACVGKGLAMYSSGCTGYCSGGAMAACNRDADCQPDDGVCNGRDPVGARKGICQCQCEDTAAGAAARNGELQCRLGVTLTVVAADAADCSAAPLFRVGPSCVPLTTGTSSGIIANANFTAMSLPADGPVSNTGEPLACSLLTADTLTGLKLRGVIDIFGSTLGDVVAELFATCS